MQYVRIDTLIRTGLLTEGQRQDADALQSHAARPAAAFSFIL